MGNGALENALFIMDEYDDTNLIYKSDIEVMAAFMEFPQEYWQIGIQYYWEKKDWGEEFFLRNLKNCMRIEWISKFLLRNLEK